MTSTAGFPAVPILEWASGAEWHGDDSNTAKATMLEDKPPAEV